MLQILSSQQRIISSFAVRKNCRKKQILFSLNYGWAKYYQKTLNNFKNNLK